MRSNYPLSSKEINDKLLLNYENLVYLLGVESSSIHYSGLYEHIAASGDYMTISPSGIPNISFNPIINLLKFDYIYRKNFDEITYGV